MKKYLIIVAFVVVSFLPAMNVQAVPIGYSLWLDTTAWIDGSDWFEITGNTWRWEHRNWTVPEQEPSATEAGPFATTVNGQTFLSSWPSGMASGDYSAYNTVIGLLPIETQFGTNAQIWLEILDSRLETTLSQAPTSGNNYTTRVFLNDDFAGGADWYHFQIYGINTDQVNVPEPSTILLIGTGIAGLGLLRRRFKN